VPHLLIDQLCVSRADRLLVADLSFGVAAGELLHLRGANGSGKTSLLEILAGLRPAAGGSVTTEPQSFAMHWVGHRNALAPQLSAIENLSFWCGVNGVDSGGVGAALERMGVPPGARRRAVRTLSAGQKRRSALARLLLASRPIWLLDEPLNALDSEGVERLDALIAAHLAQGGAVLAASHGPLAGQWARLELGG